MTLLHGYTTVDKFIAREDGSFDFFLMEGDHVADLLKLFPETIPAHLREKLGIASENQIFDAVLMGRGTYEVGLKEGITNPYPQMKQYVVSRTLKASPTLDFLGNSIFAGGAVVLLEQALKDSQERLLIISPWITSASVTQDFIRQFEQLLRRNVKVYIGYRLYLNSFLLNLQENRLNIILYNFINPALNLANQFR